MIDKEDKIFLTMMVFLATVGLFSLHNLFNSSRERSSFIQKGIELGCIEYKLLDTKTGKTELRIVDTKKEELGSWLGINLYHEPATISAAPIYGIVSFSYPIYKTLEVATGTLNDCVDRQALDGHPVQAEETR